MCSCNIPACCDCRGGACFVFTVQCFLLMFSLLPEYLPQLLITQLPYPVFAGSNSHFGKVFFLLNHLINAFLKDEAFQQFAHFGKLCENQDFFPAFYDTVQQFEQQFRFARQGSVELPVFQELCRVVAYLLERQYHL